MYPFVITPSANRYLYIKINGIALKTDTSENATASRPRDCFTSNRIILHTGTKTTVVCPSREPEMYQQFVEIYSDGWVKPAIVGSTVDQLGFEPSSSVVVEYIGKETGRHSLMWLELSRR